MQRTRLGWWAGLLVGALPGAGIFFLPHEPLKVQIFLAAALKGALTGLLLASVLRSAEGWARTLLSGAALGGLMGLVVALAKGFAAAPYVAPSGVVEGLGLAAILKKWGR